MHFEVKTELTSDPSVDGGLITEYSIEAYDSRPPEEYDQAGLPRGTVEDGDGCFRAKVAEFTVGRLHLGLCYDLDVDPREACDALSGEWDGVASLFLSKLGEDARGFYTEEEDTEDCCVGDVLMIGDLQVEPAYQDRGFEMAIAQSVIDTLGSGCDLAVYCYANEEREHEIQRFTEMGFQVCMRDGEPMEYIYLNLHHNHPRVEELLDTEHNSLGRYVAIPLDKCRLCGRDDAPEPTKGIEAACNRIFFEQSGLGENGDRFAYAWCRSTVLVSAENRDKFCACDLHNWEEACEEYDEIGPDEAWKSLGVTDELMAQAKTMTREPPKDLNLN